MVRQYAPRMSMINAIKQRWNITNPEQVGKIVVCFEEVFDQTGVPYWELMGRIEEAAKHDHLTVVEEMRWTGTL